MFVILRFALAVDN